MDSGKLKAEKIARVFGSCVNKDQLQNALKWSKKLIDKDLQLYGRSSYILGAFQSNKFRLQANRGIYESKQ